MSGICGIIDFSDSPVAVEDLRRMTDAARHRGPDGIHFWTRDNAGLANLRLDITPESRTEIQPLAHADAGVVLTADARIDNRSDLIHELGSRGFLSAGKLNELNDAELIVAAYRCWGTDCPVHLVGDFAFAIWDQHRNSFFAARDPMGMRPFYYQKHANRFLFASEVKQVLAAPAVTAEIDETVVGMHLTGLFSPLEWSYYRGVSQLPPAHSLLIDRNNCRTWRYWDIDPGFRIKYRDENQYVEHFRDIFKEAVRCRLRSFKPVGVLLSGGLDSGSIASTAGWLFENEKNRASSALHAFCWAFHELPQCDERHISSKIIEHYEFPEHLVSMDDHWPLKDYPEHGPDRDDPYIGTYQGILETAMHDGRSQGLGVMLSGDRGDLTMGGAIWDYWHLFRLLRIKELRESIRVYIEQTGLSAFSFLRRYLIRSLATRIWPPGYTERLRWSIRKMLGHGRLDPAEWIRPEFVRRIGLQEIYESTTHNPGFRDRSRLNRYQDVFLDMHMRGMVWSDRTNSRFGLGFTDPWSDLRLVRFVLAVPQHIFNRPGEHKRLVRQAMKGIIPEEALLAARKISPEPAYISAITDKARMTVYSLIRDSRAAARGYIDEKKLLDHYERFRRGGEGHPCFWCTLTLEMWLRQYWQ